VRAYVEAILADDCRLAELLVSPERRERARNKIEQECTNEEAPYLVSADIEDIMIKECSGITTVTLIADFYTSLGPKITHPAYNDQLMYATEPINGTGYVKP